MRSSFSPHLLSSLLLLLLLPPLNPTAATHQKPSIASPHCASSIKHPRCHPLSLSSCQVHTLFALLLLLLHQWHCFSTNTLCASLTLTHTHTHTHSLTDKRSLCIRRQLPHLSLSLSGQTSKSLHWTHTPTSSSSHKHSSTQRRSALIDIPL